MIGPVLGLRWEAPADERIIPYLTTILHSWEGTPVSDAEPEKGRGANCASFVFDALCEITKTRPQTKNVRRADVFHSKLKAMFALRRFRRSFPLKEVREGEGLQPGDVLVFGLLTGGPAHACIVGPRRNTLWHCDSIGVCYTGWVCPAGQKLLKVYRCTNRQDWFPK